MQVKVIFQSIFSLIHTRYIYFSIGNDEGSYFNNIRTQVKVAIEGFTSKLDDSWQIDHDLAVTFLIKFIHVVVWKVQFSL